jgi:MoaA/NifB/PqqE/SkfB family radical SAM enzyme
MNADQIAPEFDHPPGYGYTMKGWDFTRAQLAAAVTEHRMLNPAFELGTNYCPWNCDFCFTQDPADDIGAKFRLANEMSLSEKLTLIQDAATLGARTINFVGAGEPTIDPDFWTIIEAMRKHDIWPIIYTEGALRLTDTQFAQRLFELGSTVVLKVNSLVNEEWQNSVVRGTSTRKQPRAQNYFAERNRALAVLQDVGFSTDYPTRLAFDTIICRENAHEILGLHEWARMRNIFILFVNYLPSGRSTDPLTNAISKKEQFEIFQQLADFDKEVFGMEHSSSFPYAGGVPCSIRGLGLYVKIQGEVWDCPGESQSLGNVRKEGLAAIWEKVRPITGKFDGGCLPRQLFWQKIAVK